MSDSPLTKSVSTRAPSWRFAPPRPLVVAHVTWVMFPLVVVMLGAKIHTYHIVIGLYEIPFRLHDLLGLLGPDVAFLCAYGLFWLIVLSLLPRYDRRERFTLPEGHGENPVAQCILWFLQQPLHASLFTGVVVFFQAVTLIIILFALGGHVWFVLQGIPLDGFMAVFAYENISQLAPLMLTKAPTLVFIGGTVGLLLLFLLPFLLRALPIVRRWATIERTPADWRRVRATWPILAVLLFGGLGVGFGQLRVSHDLVGFQSLGLVPIAEGIVTAYQSETLDGLEASDIGREIALEIVAREGQDPRLNVVLIVLESARARSMTPYRPKLKTTPFLAKLARRGARVKTAYTVVPHTSKALVSILCGIYPNLNTRIHEAEPDGIPVPCLAKLLRERGYATAYYQTATKTLEARETLVKNAGYAHFESQESLAKKSPAATNVPARDDMAMVAPSLAWVDRQRSPFFITYLTHTARDDYKVPPGFRRRRFSEVKPLNDYLNALAYTDTFVQRLIQGFKKRGLIDHTLFVLIGDHGEAFGEHGRHGHDAVIYDEGLHVPLILYGARVQPGEVIDGLRQTIDVMPTVLDLLGYDIVAGTLPGRSLRRREGHASLLHSCWYRNACMAVRDGRHKTIYHYRSHPPQVFDIEADPLETRDLTKTRRKGAFDLARAVARMKAWRKATNQRYRAHQLRRLSKLGSLFPRE